MSVQTTIKRHTIKSLAKMKGAERISMLTAYDTVTASCLDNAGVDILLVGDSVGNVVYGFESTHPVTLEMTLAHTYAVTKGSTRSFVIADLPFMTYQVSVEEAVRNAGRCLAESNAQAVKIEGASPYIISVVKRLVEIGIPVMGHIGLTPQAIHQMGGFYKHGKSDSAKQRLEQEAQMLAEAGCFSIVLECVEEELSKKITQAVPIITIGIGSGNVCDGEVLVINDLLGYTPGKAPSFAKPMIDLKSMVTECAQKFVKQTKESHV